MIERLVEFITKHLSPTELFDFLPELLRVVESGVMKDGRLTEETLIAIQVEIEKLRNGL